jgi:hypothetical protein
MKILLGKLDGSEVVAKIDTIAEVTCRDVFTGIGIHTDQGFFGIAQRDDGIEVVLDGKLVWSSMELKSDE